MFIYNGRDHFPIFKINSPLTAFYKGLVRFYACVHKNVCSPKNLKIAAVAGAIFSAIAIGVTITRHYFMADKTPREPVISFKNPDVHRSAESSFVAPKPGVVPLASIADAAITFSFAGVMASVEKVVEDYKQEVAKFQEGLIRIRSNEKETKKDKQIVHDALSTTITFGLRNEKGLLHGAGTKMLLDTMSAMGWFTAECGTFEFDKFISGERFVVSVGRDGEDSISKCTRGKHNPYGGLEDEEGVEYAPGLLLKGVFKRGLLTSGIRFQFQAKDKGVWRGLGLINILREMRPVSGSTTMESKITIVAEDRVIVIEEVFEKDEDQSIKGTKTTFFADGRPTTTEPVSADESAR